MYLVWMSTHQKSLYLLVPSDNFAKLLLLLDFKKKSLCLWNWYFLVLEDLLDLEVKRWHLQQRVTVEIHLRCWSDIIRLHFPFAILHFATISNLVPEYFESSVLLNPPRHWLKSTYHKSRRNHAFVNHWSFSRYQIKHVLIYK